MRMPLAGAKLSEHHRVARKQGHKTLQKRDSRISVADIQCHSLLLQSDDELNADTEAESDS